MRRLSLLPHHRRGRGGAAKADPSLLILPLAGTKQVVITDSTCSSTANKSNMHNSHSTPTPLPPSPAPLLPNPDCPNRQDDKQSEIIIQANLHHEYQKQRRLLIQRQSRLQDMLLLEQQQQQDDDDDDKKRGHPTTSTTTTGTKNLQTKLLACQQALAQLDYDWQGMLLRQVLPPINETTLQTFEQQHGTSLWQHQQQQQMSSLAAAELQDVIIATTISKNNKNKTICINKKYILQECLGQGNKVASSSSVLWRVQAVSKGIQNAALAMHVYSKADLLLLKNNNNKETETALMDLIHLRYELKCLQQLSHPNLLQLHDLWNGPSNLYVVTESEWMTVSAFQETYYPLTCRSCCRAKNEWTMIVCTIAQDVLQALVYLHEQVGICHGNIQVDNIVLMAASAAAAVPPQQQQQQHQRPSKNDHSFQLEGGMITVDQVRLINLSPPPLSPQPPMMKKSSASMACEDDNDCNYLRVVMDNRNDSNSSDGDRLDANIDQERSYSNLDDLCSLGVTLLGLLNDSQHHDKDHDHNDDVDDEACRLREWIQQSWVTMSVEQHCCLSARSSLAQLLERFIVRHHHHRHHHFDNEEEEDDTMFLEDKSFC